MIQTKEEEWFEKLNSRCRSSDSQWIRDSRGSMWLMTASSKSRDCCRDCSSSDHGKRPVLRFVGWWIIDAIITEKINLKQKHAIICSHPKQTVFKARRSARPLADGVRAAKKRQRFRVCVNLDDRRHSAVLKALSAILSDWAATLCVG